MHNSCQASVYFTYYFILQSAIWRRYSWTLKASLGNSNHHHPLVGNANKETLQVKCVKWIHCIQRANFSTHLIRKKEQRERERYLVCPEARHKTYNLKMQNSLNEEQTIIVHYIKPSTHLHFPGHLTEMNILYCVLNCTVIYHFVILVSYSKVKINVVKNWPIKIQYNTYHYFCTEIKMYYECIVFGGLSRVAGTASRKKIFMFLQCLVFKFL